LLRSTDVRLVVGTRPEAIKLAPVARALAARGIAPSLILTGQHPALDAHESWLRDYAAVALDCPGEQDPHAHVSRVTAAVRPLLGSPPDLLVVQGDTSSALGAALAAFSTRVPVAHVEAGLRTHDPALPWPEEEYRTAIDAQSDLLFAPTEHAAANLQAECVPGTIHVTGNSGIDSLFDVERGLPPPVLRESNRKRVLVTCHRRESWGEGLSAIAEALIDLARRGDLRVDFVLHPNAHVSRRMAQLLNGHPRIRLIRACGHAELVQRMRDADLVLSDSGGIQEEAPAAMRVLSAPPPTQSSPQRQRSSTMLSHWRAWLAAACLTAMDTPDRGLGPLSTLGCVTPVSLNPPLDDVPAWRKEFPLTELSLTF
jgi:UDP-N-acetylglucosamine 2-epimerase (non-hydrolysing)